MVSQFGGNLFPDEPSSQATCQLIGVQPGNQVLLIVLVILGVGKLVARFTGDAIYTTTTGKTQDADGQDIRRRPNIGAVGVDPDQGRLGISFFYFSYADGNAVGLYFLFFF